MDEMPEDRTASERISSGLGKTPAEVAALDRYQAANADGLAARLRFELACMDAAGALRDFSAAWQRSEERLVTQEAEEVATHPDLVEVNVSLDGWYGSA